MGRGCGTGVRTRGCGWWGMCVVLTGAVGGVARPGAVGQALSGGGARQQVAVHAGVDDRVGEGGAVQPEHPSVTRGPWVPTLHRCTGGQRRKGGRKINDMMINHMATEEFS